MADIDNKTMQIIQKESWITSLNGLFSLFWKFLLVIFIVSLFFGGNDESFDADLIEDDGISLTVLNNEGMSVKAVQDLKIPQVALVSIKGIIAENELGVLEPLEQKRSDTLKKLFYIKTHPEIKGVILQINSPGGTVYDSDMIASYIAEIRNSGIKVVALLQEQATSGGYYIASQSDEIIAHYLTLTGSIGSIIELPNANELLQKIGLEFNTITSGDMKGMGSMYIEMSEEEKSVFQAMIDESYERFLDFVENGRGMDRDKLREIADGRVYTGKQALELGLVDKLGGYADAVESMQVLMGVENVQISELKVEYSPYDIFWKSFGEVQSMFSKNAELEMVQRLDFRSRVLYL